MRAIILAGGTGTRMRPYTTVLPKPLMPIGDVPIADIVVNQLKYHGITNITMAVGYLAELLMAYFGDGSKYGISICYSKENSPLGTAGPLALIPNLDSTFLLMNGDVLTTLNYADLVAYHRNSGAVATIAMHPRRVKIDLGVIQTNGSNELVDYIEKPTHEYVVSMGVYVFEPTVLRYIRPGEPLDFPDLIRTLLRHGERVIGYPFDGYWQDIGRPDDYERAVEEFECRKRELLPYAAADGVLG
ncbi:MAG: NTP transferase domain-containing protein [Chloroflexi bacterium]|nr:NTP transferase domain-containing protein [Chloroflexota bacterium]